jgi:hypothetical protein
LALSLGFDREATSDTFTAAEVGRGRVGTVTVAVD